MKKVLILLLFILSGCAVHFQGLGPANEAPSLTKNAFLSADGRVHKVDTWAPEAPPWAVVIALHGFNDYRHAFQMPGAFFAANGVLVLAYDQRGFGDDEKAGIWPKKTALKSDLLEMLALVHQKYPRLPVFVLGESMGGAVALYSLSNDTEAASGLVLVSPAVWGWVPVNIIYKPALWMTAHLMPGKKFAGRPLKLVPSDNEKAMIAMSKDPKVIKKTRIDAVYGLSRLMEHAMKAAPEIQIPTLLLYGDRDDLVPEKMFERLWKKLPDGEKKRIIYPNGYHMLLRDCQAEKPWHEILDFLATRSNHPLKEVKESPPPGCQSPASRE